MENTDRIKIKKMNEHVWLLDDAGQATGYLVAGSKKALVIDTMNGIADVKAAVRTLTDLPLMVVNTHGHCDHVFGNVFFEEAYINPLDLPVVEEHMQLPEFAQICSRGFAMPPLRDIKGGDQIDLGGLTVEIIDLPGHTRGSILLLLKEDGILFTGDTINRHLWLQLEHSLPIPDSLEALSKVLWLQEKAEYILHGHATDFEPISLIGELYDGLADLCAGRNMEADEDYTWFAGKAKLHPFGDGKSAIIYLPEKR